MSLNKRLINTGGAAGGGGDFDFSNITFSTTVHPFGGAIAFNGVFTFPINTDGSYFLAKSNSAPLYGYQQKIFINSPYDLTSGVTYDSSSFYTHNASGVPSSYLGRVWNFDGTKSFTFDAGRVHEHTMSPPWKVYNPSYEGSVLKSFGSVGRNPHYTADGTKILTTDGVIYVNNLTTAYNCNTMTGSYYIANAGLGMDNTDGAIINADGTKMALLGWSGSGWPSIRQYNLTTPFDPSTYVYANIHYTDTSAPKWRRYDGFFITPDGTKAYIGIDGYPIRVYNLT